MNTAFIEALAEFDAGFEPHRDLEQSVMRERDALARAMRCSLEATSVASGNPLIALHRQVRSQIESAIAAWAQDWDDAAPMRQLAEEFSDRIVLLVYGKVNAGKSSFCNLFVELNERLGAPVLFRIEANQRTVLQERFAEGVTETTTRIQGVELGDRLVLLDSPGLHSVNAMHGDLTRRYTDSADAVIWLTPSTSPGQVQELDDLVEELRRAKPLLPVLSRSDRFVEDEDAVTGEFMRVLQAKTPAVRKGQEDDVYKRTRQALDASGLEVEELLRPLSISTHYYQINRDRADVEQLSGLDRLFDELTRIVGKAALYKQGKASQMVSNYLEGAVLRRLTEDIAPEVRLLNQRTQAQQRELEDRKSGLASEVLGDMLVCLPDLVEQYRECQDTKGLAESLKRELGALVTAAAQRELERYVAKVDAVMVDLAQDDLGQFQQRTVAVQQESGRMWQAAGATGGAVLGAEIGTLLLPGVGTLVGAMLGGLAGGAGGSVLRSSETIHLSVGVSSEEVQVKCEQLLRIQIPRLVGVAIDSCIEAIRPMQTYAARLEVDIDEFKRRIERIKEQYA